MMRDIRTFRRAEATIEMAASGSCVIRKVGRDRAAWIAARLGGWNCYYGKPGPKTMRDGWDELIPLIQGFLLATSLRDP
jgi:hypothetical protein